MLFLKSFLVGFKERSAKEIFFVFWFSSLLFLLTFFSLPERSMAIENPSAVYCEVLGYNYVIEKDSEGREQGFCLFPDNSRAGAWDFLKGDSGKTFSYCSKMGYDIATRTVESEGYQRKYAVCITSDENKTGVSEIPVIDLMEKNGDWVALKEDYNRILPKEVEKNSSSMEQNGVKEVLPESFDWRNMNGHSYIGPVRDQGSCGSCYAFGAAASAEGTYNYATGLYDGTCADFSEAYIAWCLGAYGPFSSNFDGCQGADYSYSELEALTIYGITWESDFPYTGRDPGSCTHWDDPVVVFNSWARIPSNDIDAIKTALMTYGVLDAAVMVDTGFEYYTGGIYSNWKKTCPQGAYTTTNHAISLVGWGNDPTYGDYWILRNSWGSSWGESGYMRIQAQSARVACAATRLEYTGQLPVSPGITNPADGSTLSGSTQTFSWSANGSDVTYWVLWVVSGADKSSEAEDDLFSNYSKERLNFYSSGLLDGSETSHSVSGLPTDGSTVYVRLWYYSNGEWKYQNYSYTAAY